MLKQDLVHKVEELGGLLKTNEEIDGQIAQISKEKEKKIAIKIQIQFRKIVFGTKHKDKKVFQMSSEGKAFSRKVRLIIRKLSSYTNWRNTSRENVTKQT
jgi:CHASE3 domain sensor protein